MSSRSNVSWLKTVALILLIGYGLALFVGTHMPRVPQAILSLGWRDKWLHLAAYAGLSFLVCWNWALRGPFGGRQCLTVVLLLGGVGAVDELTQIPFGREAELLDWCADLLGAAAGALLFLAGWRLMGVTRQRARQAAGEEPQKLGVGGR